MGASLSRIHVSLDEKSLLWLDSHTSRLRSRSEIIRDLIETKMLFSEVESSVLGYQPMETTDEAIAEKAASALSLWNKRVGDSKMREWFKDLTYRSFQASGSSSFAFAVCREATNLHKQSPAGSSFQGAAVFNKAMREGMKEAFRAQHRVRWGQAPK